MRIAADSKSVPAGSYRLLADVRALDVLYADKRAPAQMRLEAALGRDFADRLVTALSEERTDFRR
jgi:hypothetical protein